MKKVLFSFTLLSLSICSFASEETYWEDCTITSSASTTLTMACDGGGYVSATFTQSCTATASSCAQAGVDASLCANFLAHRQANRNQSAVAALCDSAGGGGNQP